jgi:hypothetical protein
MSVFAGKGIDTSARQKPDGSHKRPAAGVLVTTFINKY